MSPIFKLNWKDLLRGLIVATLAGIFLLPVSELAKYIPILQNPMLQLIVSTVFGYLSKNLATDDKGKLMGAIKIHD